MTRPYHPNIDQGDGKISDCHLGDGWSPQLRLFECMQTLRRLLQSPDLFGPLEPQIAREYVDNPEVFAKKARAQCEKLL